jgi:predicted Zn-dependent protease
VRRFSPVRLALSLAALAGCATNPVTGRQEVVFMSPEREAAVGRQAAAQVEREMGLVRDPALVAYVQKIGDRMADLSPRRDVDYQFAIADMAEPNAFALPGGYVYVSRGLLALANAEDELAGVIGHEIGHVAARHSAQRETRAMGVGLLSVLGTIAAGVVGGGTAAQMASQLGQVAGAGLIASYSRDQERQADDVGQQLAAAGGWDPDGLADFLVTLEREGHVRTGQERNPSFLDSHPQRGERAVVARERAPTLPRGAAPRIARGRDAYLARIDGLLVGPNPDGGVFDDERFLHPGLGFAIDFPPRWQTQNAPQAVGALAPERDAMLLVEMQGGSGDPRAAAQQWAQAQRVRVADSGATQIGGWSAFRILAEAQSQQGSLAVDATWIAHPKGMFRVTGLAQPQRYRARAPALQQSTQSFRAISDAERARARPTRLRIATARAGETLQDLGRRHGNRWSPAETAVANAVDPDAALRAGQKIKLAVRE